MNSFVIFADLACFTAAGISSYPTAEHGPVGYYGPLAEPIVLKEWHIADTHEALAAREDQYIAVAKASHISGASGGDSGAGLGGGYGDHGVYSYGPGTDDVYKGEYGYAGLHSARQYKHY